MDLDDVFGGFGLPPEMAVNQSAPDGGDDSDSDAKSISHAPREELSAADMSDSGQSVSSTRSHSNRGHRKRVVVDRSRTRSKDSLSALNKSVESGLFSYKDGDSDEEDENLLFGEGEKAERPKVKSSSKSSDRPTIAAAKEKQALDRTKLHDRMRRERSGAVSPKRDSEKEHNADTKKESSKKRSKDSEKERSTHRSDSHGSRKEEKERSKHKSEHGEHAEKERSSGKRRNKDKERSTKRNDSHGSRKEETEPTEPALPTPQPYRSKTEKKPKEQPYEPACPTPQPYRSKTQKKKKEQLEEPADPTPQPYRSKTERKASKEKKASSKKVASGALDETMRHDNLSLSPVKPAKQLKSAKAPPSPSSPAPRSPTRKASVRSPGKRSQSRKVDHAEEEEKKEEKPRKKLVLRRPSLKGEQSPRSLTEAEENWAEEASRASTHQSGATTDDDDDDVSDDGTVLQFDPTQSDNVYRVKQIQREDSIYNIKNVDGKVVTGHIGEINDSLSKEQKQDVPIFNALGNDDDHSSSQSEDDLVPSAGEESDSESLSSHAEDEDAPNSGPMHAQDNWHESFVLAPSGEEEELSDPSGNESVDESVLNAPSGGEEESETIMPLEPKALRERRAPGRCKSEMLQPFPPSDQKAPRRKAPGRAKSSDFGSELHKASDSKKKKVRRKQVGDNVDLEGPSDSELDSPQKPRRRLKKKGGNIDPPSLGDEHEDPSEPANLNRRAVMQPKKNSEPDDQPQEDTDSETLASVLTTTNFSEPPKVTTDTGFEDEGKQPKRMSMGMAIGRYFGRSSRRNSAETDAEESDGGGSIGGSVHGGVFGRGKKKHMLLGDDDSFSSGDGATPF
jgi:hypothetical protein